MLAKPGKKENIEQNAPSEVPENYGAVDDDDVPF